MGVFAALSRGIGVALISAKLYLPKEWTESNKRCDKACIPTDEREFKIKSEIGLEMVRNARADGLRFSWVGADAGYVKKPDFLRAVAYMGEKFLVHTHASQRLFLEDTNPAQEIPAATGGRKSNRLTSHFKNLRVDAWMKRVKTQDW